MSIDQIMLLVRNGQLGEEKLSLYSANAKALGLTVDQEAEIAAALLVEQKRARPKGCPRCMRTIADCVCEGSGTY